MLEDITIGQYYPGDSIIHKLDPRVKIAAALIYMTCLFVVNNYWGYLIVITAGVAAVSLSRIPAGFFMKGLRPVFLLLMITFLLNLFLTPGTVLLELGFLKATKEGAVLGIYMAVRLAMLVIVASLVSLTTTPVNLTEGIEKLLHPFKRVGVPAHELAMMMTIALRFIPTLIEEANKIIKAQMARGAVFDEGGFIQRIKNIIPVVVPLFVGALRRADELATAMEARCYRGGEGRTRLRELSMEVRDVFALIVTFVFFAVSLWSRWWF
ncbi:MAG TPA: transporter [Peptococcaceae bacterium]|nr:MAG: Energy-coupling factor transporter transmembrane protein EcfT [Clostridia bacterium 41_269]HBT20938.1 transporter [Peptococcaceae bacterium]